MKQEKKQKETKEEHKTYAFLAFVSFKGSKKMYTFGTDNDSYRIGDIVVVETIRGLELGKIVKETQRMIPNSFPLKPIIRKAMKKDIEMARKNVAKSKKAMRICKAAIQRLNLDMDLIETEYTLNSDKVTFSYVSQQRVDFRDLLKELARILKCRIELRQVGIRNKAKIVGGVGSCGMETCCSRFLNDFDAISINMAKNQLLSLNIEKLSGQCGKLKCCLKFENEQYKKLREGLPKLYSQVEWKGKKYRISSMNVLLQQVKIENKEDVQFLDFKELWPHLNFSNRF